MSMRDIVTGSDMCTPSGDGGAGPSNAVGSLVNTLLGGGGKTQEQLRELPHVGPGGSMLGGPHGGLANSAAAAAAAASHANGFQISGMAGPSFAGPRGAMLAGMPGPMMGQQRMGGPGMMGAQQPHEWDSIFGGASASAGPSMQQPHIQMPHMAHDAPPDAVMRNVLQLFIGGGRAAAPFAAGPMPPGAVGGLSVVDKCRIRDRATILSRHIYADQGERFADQQVGSLLASLHINPAELPGELPHVHDQGWHDAWDHAQQHRGHMASEEVAAGAHQAGWEGVWGGQRGPGPMMQQQQRPMSTGWADEYAAHAGVRPPMLSGPAPWADEFATQQGPDGWASEFASARPESDWAGQFVSDAAVQAAAVEGGARTRGAQGAMESTRALADFLSRDANPKMRNSNFMQFVSKLSRGELLFEDNKVVDGAGGLGATTSAPGAWADEFAGEGGQQQQGLRPPGLAGNWEDEFARGVADIRIDEGEAAAALEHAWREGGGASGAMWADELAAAEGGVMGADSDWDRIFGGGGATAFDQGMSAQRDGKYVFSRDNPFLGDADAFAKGKDLFRRGVLTEAALALESEVTSRPSNAEAWRLLGTVHAENDDDPQAIAAMSSAQRADPSNLDVLLSLGVSHTNELASGEALQHLTTWLASNPQHVRIAAAAGPMPDSSQALSHTLRMFEAAAREAPQDFEVRVALGVLHHLGRQYSAAISAFEQALQLRPQDYSLWNKLGATLANNARSAEAIYAYQKALDLKPNYMRAWTNMGISFANLGDYDKSARFYVRALSLNPNATHVWGYLRTALACSGRMDLVDAVDAQDVGAVTAALPLLGQ